MTNENSSDADYLKALQHRSQIYRSLHDSRIGREFKLVIYTVTFFLVCVSAKLFSNIPATSPLLSKTLPLYDIFTLAAFVFVCAMSFLYLKGSASANDRNQKDAEVAEDVMVRYLENSPPHDLRKQYREIDANKKLRAETRPNRYRWIWQWVVIVVGAAFSFAMILFA
jgi:hypothetical protein